MKLTKHQDKVFTNITNDIEEFLVGDNWNLKGLFSLTGFAGVGKTVIVTEIIKHFKNDFKVKITTPTHKSLGVVRDMLDDQNVKIPMSTIHSHLNLKQTPAQSTKVDYILKVDKTKKLSERIDILIIDESSMVSDELFKYILEALDNKRFNCVLFVGDPYQLSPVDGKENPVYYNKDVKHYQLTEVVRQAQDNPLIYFATKFREAISNKVVIDVRKTINEIPLLDTVVTYTDMKKWMKTYLDDNTDSLLASYTNNSVDSYNRFVRSYIYKDNNLPYIIDQEYVILQSAVSEGNSLLYPNGKMIKVDKPTLIQEEGMSVWEYNNIRTVDPSSMNVYNEIKTKLRDNAVKDRKLWFLYYEFLERYTSIKHTHASTIHKLQGTSVDNIYINLQDIISFMNVNNRDDIYRLIYVALTRPRYSAHILV